MTKVHMMSYTEEIDPWNPRFRSARFTGLRHLESYERSLFGQVRARFLGYPPMCTSMWIVHSEAMAVGDPVDPFRAQIRVDPMSSPRFFPRYGLQGYGLQGPSGDVSRETPRPALPSYECAGSFETDPGAVYSPHADGPCHSTRPHIPSSSPFVAEPAR